MEYYSAIKKKELCIQSTFGAKSLKCFADNMKLDQKKKEHTNWFHLYVVQVEILWW